MNVKISHNDGFESKLMKETVKTNQKQIKNKSKFNFFGKEEKNYIE